MKTLGRAAILREYAIVGFIVVAVLGLSALRFIRAFRAWMDYDPDEDGGLATRNLQRQN